MSNYRKTMADALREMYPLDEESQIDEATMSSSQIARLKTAYEPMRDKKISTSNADKLSAMMDKVGKDKEALIQLFKADIPFVSQSAVTKLITKHNMKGAEINKLREEVELDEATKQVLAHGGKGKYKVTKDGDKIEIKFGGKVVGTADFDRGADSFFVSIKGEKGQKSFDDAQAIADYFAKNKITEEVGLDEGKMNNTTMQANKPRFERKGQELEAYANKFGGVDKKDMMKVAAMLKRGDKSGALKYAKTLDTDPKEYIMSLIGEETELDERFRYKIYTGKTYLGKEYGKDEDEAKKNALSGGGAASNWKTKLSSNDLKAIKEEVDLDEGKMSQLHQYIKDKKSAEEIAKLMGLDVKTVKSLMSSHHPEDVDEASAYADARRSMSKDKDFSRKDSADDDTDASDDDIKGASKNIIMQMRKAQSLGVGGDPKREFKVEFGDGKKVKIPVKMAMAVQQKYNAMKRPTDKEKFQARIGKSYKDMLSALKEELQPKKESILERMNRKLKENKHG
jgi:hypothetical protein